MKKFWTIVVIAGCIASLSVGYKLVVATERRTDHPIGLAVQTKFDKVLDGDTIVISGEAIKVRGIDTPELGPWAKCWGEALAAGFSKARLEEEITNRKYTVSEKRADASGNLSAKFTDKEGFDLIDPMTVYGGAAVTDGRWNWCGDLPKKQGKEEDKAPRGPNLWWPSGKVYDERALD